MNKKDIRTIIIIISIILITLIVLIKIRNTMENKVTGSTIKNTESGSNIKRAAPTPSSCTSAQNCGSPSCDVASGRGGGCGCG